MWSSSRWIGAPIHSEFWHRQHLCPRSSTSLSRLDLSWKADRSLAAGDELGGHSNNTFPELEYNGRYSTPHPRQVVALLDLRCFISKSGCSAIELERRKRCPPFLVMADWRICSLTRARGRRLYGLHNHFTPGNRRKGFQAPIRPELPGSSHPTKARRRARNPAAYQARKAEPQQAHPGNGDTPPGWRYSARSSSCRRLACMAA